MENAELKLPDGDVTAKSNSSPSTPLTPPVPAAVDFRTKFWLLCGIGALALCGGAFFMMSTVAGRSTPSETAVPTPKTIVVAAGAPRQRDIAHPAPVNIPIASLEKIVVVDTGDGKATESRSESAAEPVRLLAPVSAPRDEERPSVDIPTAGVPGKLRYNDKPSVNFFNKSKETEKKPVNKK